jgi:RimJ/RimL family protein N-acetyltransferase
MQVIHATGLTLVPQIAAHAAELFQVLSDPALYEHEGEPPVSVDWLRARLLRLESRVSPDGQQGWLNWVIREADGDLVGFVQATVLPDGRALVAYMVSSRHWGRGLASKAVVAMAGELVLRHGVHTLFAVLKRSNGRSLRLLERLGFVPASADEHVELHADTDELLMRLRPVPAWPD